MFFRILKKDLKRKRTMNIILFLFIIMATAFLASSATNLVATSTAVDDFLKTSKVADYTVIMYSSSKEDENIIKMNNWLQTCEDVDSYSTDEAIMLSKDNIRHNDDKYTIKQSIMVQAVPQIATLTFDEKEQPVELEPGEIAIPNFEAEVNKINLGDTITIKYGNVTKDFTVKTIFKDSLFGSSLMGFKRILLNDSDYQQYASESNSKHSICYSINSDRMDKLEKSFKQQKFNIIGALDIASVKTVYVMDMLIAAILIIVSICLILISFLILRFTIVFTLQEDYKEIGIMKAVGLKNRGIKEIYMIKYMVLSVLGAAIGFFISIPFSEIMLKQVSVNICMNSVSNRLYINVISAVAIVFIVLLFCYHCTSKLNKFSAIDAIRNGSNGERFKKKNFLKLHNSRLPAVLYMAVNDILSNIRRYFVLVLTFIIGTMIIIIPINAINTLQDDSLVEEFGQIKSDFYIDTQDMDKYIVDSEKKDFLSDLHSIEQFYCDNGVQVNLFGESGFSFNIYKENEDDAETVTGMQGVESDISRYKMLSGSMPELNNEVALTKRTAEKIGVTIGDTVHVIAQGQNYSMLVTGLYESMTNMGTGIRIANSFSTDMGKSVGMNAMQGDFVDRNDISGQIEKLRELTPQYKVLDGSRMLEKYLGSIIAQLNNLKNLLVCVVLGINALITVLMCKTFIAKEKGEISMLRSIGFSYAAIRKWQVARFAAILIVSVVLGVIISNLLNPVTNGQIFSMMGASELQMTVDPLQVYLLYPALILGVTLFVCSLTVISAGKVDVKEINNME